MGLTFYRIAQLRALAKNAMRALSGMSGIGTEPGADLAIIVDAAAFMLNGTQVAAQHVYEQIFPKTADAENRERMVSFHGLTFEKEATKARGYIMVGALAGNVFDKQIKKGTTFEFPASAFADGKGRTFVAVEDGLFRSAADAWSTATSGAGTSQTKLRTRNEIMAAGDVVSFAVGGVASLAVIRFADKASMTHDTFAPYEAAPPDGTTLVQVVSYLMIKVEAEDAGVEGNCASYVINPLTAVTNPITCSDATVTHGFVVEMAGGGDAVGEIDQDDARVIRVLEDTIGGVPSNGNPQHWREIALACPDVDLDDAIVYMGVRGPGSIDIVCIGRSGQVRASVFAETNVGHLAHGHSSRRIGDMQAALVEQWCNYLPDGTRRTNYYDDLKCRSVEWDYRGPSDNHFSTDAFFRSSNYIKLEIVALPGYGQDAGARIAYTPHTQSKTRLYPNSASVRIDDRFKPGQRVGVLLQNPGQSRTYPFATVFTTILGIDPDRRYLTIADVSTVAAMMMGNSTNVTIASWYSAGPLDQQVDDAVHAYFDSLGPGSYTSIPHDPGYQRGHAAAIRKTASLRIERWPDEGRRWNAGLRAAALKAKILAIPGIASVDIRDVDDNAMVDFDPAPLQTLSLCGVNAVINMVGS